MKPSITISDMTLNIRLDDILEALNKDSRLELIRMVAMDEPLIQDIVDQLTDGWTHDMSSVGDAFLNKLRIKLAPLMGEVAKEAIRNLVQERELAKADARRHSDWAWKLFHAWPRDASRRDIPEIPDFAYVHKLSAEEARAVAGVEAPEEPESESWERRQLWRFVTEGLANDDQKKLLKKLGWIEYSRMGAFWVITDAGKAVAEELGYL